MQTCAYVIKMYFECDCERYHNSKTTCCKSCSLCSFLSDGTIFLQVHLPHLRHPLCRSQSLLHQARGGTPGMRRIIIVNTFTVEIFRPLEFPWAAFFMDRWCLAWIWRRRTVDGIKRRRRRAFVLFCSEVRGFILEFFCYFVPINITCMLYKINQSINNHNIWLF